MTVARLIYYILPDQTVFRIKATTLTKIFVWLDIVAFLVQAVGGTMLSSTDESPKLLRPGQQTYMTGIGIQMGFIILFGVFTARFYIKMKRDNRPDRPIRLAKWLVAALYAVFVLIVVSFLSFRGGPPRLSLPADYQKTTKNEMFQTDPGSVPRRFASSSVSSSLPPVSTMTTQSSETRTTPLGSMPCPCSWALSSSTS